VTISDVAKRAGVSKASVSHALNGKPGLSERTRRRILAVIDEVGWCPNRAARALSGSRSGACGLALARSPMTVARETFFSKLLSGIEAELSAHQIGFMLQIVGDVDAETATLRRWWAERRVDGVILVDLRVKDPRVAAVEHLQLPAVVVGGPGATGTLPFIPGNDTGGVRQIVRHLVALGHCRIDRVAGSSAFASTKARTRAFRETLARAGGAGRVTCTDYTASASASATRNFLVTPPSPTAIVYDNDVMAVAGMEVAQEMGVVVPRDLSVVSFEDSILCEAVGPSLTACSRDVEGYSARAARALVALIGGEPVGTEGELPCSLIHRASTTRPPFPGRSSRSQYRRE
jgi:DNA-binding LacI/PurR family transcriptional regulator